MQKVMPPKLEDGGEPERLQVVVPPTLARRLEEWRRKQERIPGKSEAIRILLERGLDAESGS